MISHRVCIRSARLPIAAALLLVALPSAASAQFLDKERTLYVLSDQLEYRRTGTGRPVQWDVASWFGDSYSRLWIKTEGEWSTGGRDGEFDVRAEFARLVTPFWELQGGVRVETRTTGSRTDTRAHLDLGLLGFAPYWFQLEPELFIAQDGQVSARLTAEYDVFVTQRLIAQPRFETFAATSENARFGVGSGINYVQPALRLRYELRREFAPYVGVDWLRQMGRTARLARAAGERSSDAAVVIGVRAWR